MIKRQDTMQIAKTVLACILAMGASVAVADEQRDAFFDQPMTDLGEKKDGSIHHTGGLSWSTGTDYPENSQADAASPHDQIQIESPNLKTPAKKPAMTIQNALVVLTEPFYPGKTPYTAVVDKLVERAVERCPNGWKFVHERMMSQNGQMVLALGLECF